MTMWSINPFIRMLIPLSCGILLKEHISNKITLSISLIFTIASLFRSSQSHSFQYQTRFIPGISIFFWLLFTGQSIVYLKDIRHNSNWFALNISDTCIIKTTSIPLSKSTFTSIEGEIILIKKMGRWMNTTGNILLYTDTLLKQIPKGSLILSSSKPKAINSKGNFSDYLTQKNIFHKLYLKEKNYSILKIADESTLTDDLRNWILSVIDKNIKDPPSNALSKALLIGFRTEMDKHTLNSFRNTGVIHVISVSGMHLALIYALVNSLLKFIFNKSISGRWKRILINLILLWGFSILCGGSPSVLRSAVMFSFILFGELFLRKNFTSNAIAGSAFCLLSIDPFMIKDLGFLLSYGAVAGLHVYNKPISHLFNPKNKLLLYGWEVFSTTISAQILTAPVILYQFGKLPTLFLITNLIAVPITSLLLIILIILCMIAPIHFLTNLTAQIVEYLSHWLINRMNSLGDLPFSTIEIHIDLIETFFLFLLILSFTKFVFSRNPIFFWLFLTSNFAWSTYALFIKWVNIHS